MEFSYEKLRERAEKALHSKFPEKISATTSNEISLYKIAIDLQNEDLQGANAEIEAHRNQYQALYDFIPFSNFTLNAHGLIIDVNQAAEQFIGVKKQELLQKSLSRYIAPDSQHVFSDHCQTALNTLNVQTAEIKILSKRGHFFYAQINSKAFTNLITQEKLLLSFIVDITDRKNNAECFYQNQLNITHVDHNSAMEKLASTIAYELNHPLAITANYLYGCISRLETGNFQVNEIIEALKKAANQSHRVAEIILRMKNFSCRGILKYELVNMNDAINETINLIKYELSSFPVTIKVLDSNCPMVMIDKIHIQQVILNLARNAIEAMRDAHTNDPKLIFEVNVVNNVSLEVCITDNGPGIPDDIIYKLFNHNFTTKSYGVGLGLSISRSIIEAHGGKLLVESSLSGGACFKFTLNTTPSCEKKV